MDASETTILNLIQHSNSSLESRYLPHPGIISRPTPFVTFVCDMLGKWMSDISPLSGGSWGPSTIPLQNMSLNASDIKIARKFLMTHQCQPRAWVVRLHQRAHSDKLWNRSLDSRFVLRPPSRQLLVIVVEFMCCGKCTIQRTAGPAPWDDLMQRDGACQLPRLPDYLTSFPTDTGCPVLRQNFIFP